MAKPSADADRTIEALLQQRAQYEQWLARLESTGNKAPPAVRDRVRGDYEARLRGVIDELRGYASTIAEELEQHRVTQGRLDAERRKAEESLAEAEVRYTVGEYGEDEWQRLSGESQRHLDDLREQLGGVAAEISRLAEVQTLIGGPSRKPEAATAPPAPEPPAPAREPEPAPAAATATTAATATAATAAKGSSAPQRAGGPEAVVVPSGVDELAFLKSVSDEPTKPAPAPAARRPSNPGARAPGPSKPVEAPSPGAGKTAGMAKTLKCNECGTFNRPTEWYCERCGAELAAL